MGHIKQIVINGICADGGGETITKDLIIAESTTNNYVVLVIGKDLVEVNVTALVDSVALLGRGRNQTAQTILGIATAGGGGG